MEKVKYESRWSEVSADGREYEYLWRVFVNGKSFTRETWCRSNEGRWWLYCSKTTHRFYEMDIRHWDNTMWKTNKFTNVKGVNKRNKKHLFTYDYRRKSL